MATPVLKGAPAKQKRGAERSGFDVVEEAFHLVRGVPWSVLGIYYIGTLPFVVGTFLFCNEFGRGLSTSLSLLWSSLLLAVLFVWMKTWHAVYARMLYRRLETNGADGAGWEMLDYAAVFRTLVRQTIIQSTGMVALPIALVSGFAFPWVYAFYQNATVLDDGSNRPMREITGDSVAYARVWPGQCLIIVWALCPLILFLVLNGMTLFLDLVLAFSPTQSASIMGIVVGIYLLAMLPVTPFLIVVAVNVFTVLVAIPFVLDWLLGIETDIFMAYISSDNGTLVLVSLLAYALVDPFAKAAFVLRCFYAASIRSGADLASELARYKRTAALLAVTTLALLAGPGAYAVDEATGETGNPVLENAESPPPPSVDAVALDAALNAELEEGVYAWRRVPINEGSNFLASMTQDFLDSIARWYKRLKNWWNRGDGEPAGGGGGAGAMLWSAMTARRLLLLLVVVLAILVGIMLYRRWRGKKEAPLVVAQAVQAPVNLEDEATMPDSLPQDEWLALAMQLRDAGQLRLALRAAFLGTLSILGERNYVSIARFKSNLDYARELRRRGIGAAPVYEVFGKNARLYEAAWYGDHAVSEEMLAAAMENQKWMRTIE